MNRALNSESWTVFESRLSCKSRVISESQVLNRAILKQDQLLRIYSKLFYYDFKKTTNLLIPFNHNHL